MRSRYLIKNKKKGRKNKTNVEVKTTLVSSEELKLKIRHQLVFLTHTMIRYLIRILSFQKPECQYARLMFLKLEGG